MAVTYFPFNSMMVGGLPDRAANAEALALYLKTFFTDGVVLHKSAALQVNAKTGLTVQIEPGTAFLDGRILYSDAPVEFTLDDPEINLNRIDRIVFRLDYVNRLMEFAVLKGEPGSDPMPPELKRDADAWEMCLAEIEVGALATEITQSKITDTRASDLCGLAAAAIKQIDTATFYEQYRAQFEEAFNDLESWSDEQIAIIEKMIEDLRGQGFVTISDFEAAVQDKENVSTFEQITLAAANWSGNTYSLEELYPSTGYNIWVQPVKPCTAEQLDAWGGAMLLADAETNVLTAMGTVPKVDIPVIIKAVKK